MKSVRSLVLCLAAWGALGSPKAAATGMQPAIRDNFNSLFMTAGYSTLLGAALGAAVLTFNQHPRDNLRYIPIGASLGFFTGTVLGAYFIFFPSLTHGEKKKGEFDDLEGFSQELPTPPVFDHKPVLGFSPTINPDKNAIEGWCFTVTLALQ